VDQALRLVLLVHPVRQVKDLLAEMVLTVQAVAVVVLVLLVIIL
jgi:hypothetical protein